MYYSHFRGEKLSHGIASLNYMESLQLKELMGPETLPTWISLLSIHELVP